MITAVTLEIGQRSDNITLWIDSLIDSSDSRERDILRFIDKKRTISYFFLLCIWSTDTDASDDDDDNTVANRHE